MFIIPSYKCTGLCTYCYARDHASLFPQTMSLFTFIRLINQRKKYGKLRVNILGGEPSEWKWINQALFYCKLADVSATLFTNGLKKVKVMPDFVYLNISHYFEKAKRARVAESLEYYHKKGVRVILRYNMELKDPESNIDTIIELAKKYDFVIHLAQAVPYDICREVGERLFKTMKKIHDAGARCDSPDPKPPCMFTDEELVWLKKNTGHITRCDILSVPFVNPDGKTLQPCTRLFLFKQPETIGSPEEMRDLFAGEVELRRNKLPLKECYECDYYKRKECFGGCYALRD